jgi:hypothetical protein
MAQQARSNAHSVTLLANPGTPSQRALRVVPADRTDLRDRAVMMARQKDRTSPLGWLDHDTHKVVKITIHQPKPSKRLLKKG